MWFFFIKIKIINLFLQLNRLTMRILGLIVARSGSKSVPNKNMKILAGKPLLEYTIDSAIASQCFQDLIFSSDSKEYADFALSKGVSVPFLRPGNLAQDSTPTIEVVIHALVQMKSLGKNYDAVCLLQPTHPFRERGSIDKAIKQFIQLGADSLISVLPVPHEWNPHWILEPNEDGYLKLATGEEEIIQHRQDLPPAFFRDGSIYITKTEVILQSHSLYGGKISYIQNNPKYYVNIDTEQDWNEAVKKLKEIGSLICCVA